MPTYEYECTKCGKVFELFQSIMEKPKRRVANGGKSCACDAPVRRLIGRGAGVIFKGSGFYQTDYRSESYKKGVKAEQADKSGGKDKSSKDSPHKSPEKPKKEAGSDKKVAAKAK